MKKERFSGIELLRIIMMLQIIFLHFCDKGGYTIFAKELGGIHLYLFYGVWYLCRCPVFVFFILTGYFLCKKEITFDDVKSRILKIYIPMLFYSMLIPLVMLLFGWCSFDDISIVNMILPLFCKGWYFLTGYILIVILSPYINKLIKSMNKKEYGILLIILLAILSIWTPLSHLKPFDNFFSIDQVISNQSGKSLYDYIFMYLLGGYLNLYIKSDDKPKFKYLFIFILCGIFQCLCIKIHHPYISIGGYNDNLFVIIQCICLVLFFRDFKFKSRFINYISSFTLEIYLIHEHYLFKYFMWDNFFGIKNISFFNTWFYPLKIIVICLIIFILCVIIELLRRLIFKVVSILYYKVKCIILKENEKD